MGMERTLAVLNGFTNIYESDLFSNVIKALRDRVGSTYSERGGRIAADHIRTAVHLLADGVRPGNVDQGYILRRLIRRSIRELHRMGWDRPFVADLAEMFIEKYRDAYPNIEILHRDILDELRIEEEAFSKTLIK